MPTYVNVPIETDPDALAQDAYDHLQNKTDGEWEPHDGQLDTWQIEANARMAATLRDTASDVPIGIFRYFGQLVNVQPNDATAATGYTDWTLTDNAGHTIPAGSHLGVPDAYGNLLDFTTTVDVVVPAGQTTALAVPIIATTEGADSNGVGSAGLGLTLLDNYAWVTSVTLEQPTQGGADAESDEDYINRLVGNLQLMAPRPILPADFAVMARNIVGVGRALALDGYNPADGTSNNQRMIAVALVDISGALVSSAVATAVQVLLSAARETTFIVNTINPTYTTIDVVFDANAWPTWNVNDVNANIVAAIQAFLSPATWGAPPFGDQLAWYNMPTVKINDLMMAIGKVEGVKDINSVTIRTGANAYAAADIALPGAAPLAQAGTVTGTVH